MIAAALVAGLVAIERAIELIYAARNTRRLLARGATEYGASHYGLIVLLHAAWLIAIVALAPRGRPPVWGWLMLYIILQIPRLWIIASLGPYWTTRIISLPDEPLRRSGPYRFLRHPNYLVVAAEIAVLPLAFREASAALVFSALNLALLAWRVRIENRALATRAQARSISSIL
jgi:methyltransferase